MIDTLIDLFTRSTAKILYLTPFEAYPEDLMKVPTERGPVRLKTWFYPIPGVPLQCMEITMDGLTPVEAMFQAYYTLAKCPFPVILMEKPINGSSISHGNGYGNPMDPDGSFNGPSMDGSEKQKGGVMSENNPTYHDDCEARCIYCGCTESAACVGGCWWSPSEEVVSVGLEPMDGDVCSACLNKIAEIRAIDPDYPIKSQEDLDKWHENRNTPVRKSKNRLRDKFAGAGRLSSIQKAVKRQGERLGHIIYQCTSCTSRPLYHHPADKIDPGCPWCGSINQQYEQ